MTDEMQAVHAELYAVLNDVVRVLEAHSLPYCLICGSLLGAVRHQAIIPWDDDVDLVLPRESYDRFEALYPAERELDYTLDLQDTWVPRVRKISGAAFVDLFVLDPLPMGRLARSWKLFRLKTLQGMLKQRPEYHRFSFTKRALLWATHTIGQPFTRETKLHAYRRIARTGGQSPWLHMSNGAFSLLGMAFKKDALTNTIFVPFGSLRVRVPQNAEQVLIQLFGMDYLNPPPEQERKPLHLDR